VQRGRCETHDGSTRPHFTPIPTSPDQARLLPCPLPLFLLFLPVALLVGPVLRLVVLSPPLPPVLLVLVLMVVAVTVVVLPPRPAAALFSAAGLEGVMLPLPPALPDPDWLSLPSALLSCLLLGMFVQLFFHCARDRGLHSFYLRCLSSGVHLPKSQPPHSV
jgi:hypothetical protein